MFLIWWIHPSAGAGREHYATGYPVALDSYGQLTSATAGTGRELVHIEFSGSWSSYEVNYADTSSTTITTYQMSYDYFSLTRGEKNYELTNHLGNVLVVISDKKLKTCEGDTVNYYTADVVQATDYSAFGVMLKGREYYANTLDQYRHGYQGSERNNELYGDGNSYTTFFRELDSRLGRWLTTDPKTSFSESPYVSMGNNPVRHTDPKGDKFIIGKGDDTKNDIKSLAGNYSHFVKFNDKTGEVSIDYEQGKSDPRYLNKNGTFNQKKYDKDVKAAQQHKGINLINDLALDTKTYFYAASNIMKGRDRNDQRLLFNDQTNTPSGTIIKSGDRDEYRWFYNVSTTPYSTDKPGDIPLEGYDGAVYIALGTVDIDFLEPVPNGAYNQRMQTREVRASMVFHELAENYFRTHGNGMSRDEAHKKAMAWEGEFFRNPTPGYFTRFYFK